MTDLQGENLICSSNSSSTPTNLTSSSEDPSSDGDASLQDSLNRLDFAKREVSEIQGRNSFSQLSSMTVKSPGRQRCSKSRRSKNRHGFSKSRTSSDGAAAKYEPEKCENCGEKLVDEVKHSSTKEEDVQIGANEHQKRTTNSTNSVLIKSESNENIGFRQPFGGLEPEGSPEQDIDASLSNNTSPTGITATFNNYYRRQRKHYEPARAVLHKSDTGADDSSLKEVGISDPPSRSSSIVQLSNNGSPEVNPRVPIPSSLVASLSGSPDEFTVLPLKHLREPKQPVYIPAVLRPTDFNSYHSQLGNHKYSSDAPRKPITQHWVRDSNANKCLSCERSFTWFRRRHHCRKCGGIFCAADTKNTIGLDRVLNFNILGIPCRACDSCNLEFTGFCSDAPRLRDGPGPNQQSLSGPEQEEAEAGNGGDWSTF